jgi:hypothetical protein
MNRTRDHQVKWNKPDSDRNASHAFSHVWNVEKKWHKRRKGTARKGEEDLRDGIREGNRVVTENVHYMDPWKGHNETNCFIQLQK